MTADTLHLTKAHGLGNDFLIALESRNPGLEASSVLAKTLCDRHRGVGADGLIYGLAPESVGADLRMVLFNADGSEAEISGNGIRCLGQAAVRAAGERSGTVVVDAGSGRRELIVTATDQPAEDTVVVQMGTVAEGPSLGPRASAFDAVHRGSAAIGNPHLVLHVESLDGIDPAVTGPFLEAEVPGGCNIHFLVVEGPSHIRLLHWERGAGVTEACGSGATVAAALARRWGIADDDTVVVDMPGGRVSVVVGESMQLIGPAVHIADIEVTV